MRRSLISLLVGAVLSTAFGLGIGAKLQAQDEGSLPTCPKSYQCDCVMLVCAAPQGCTLPWCGLLTAFGGGCYQACDSPQCSYQAFYCDDYCIS